MTRRFSRRISGDSLLSGLPFRNASIPPLNSIVRIAAAERRSRTGPIASDSIEIVCKFGRKRRFVLMLEWLTLWPTWTPFPVTGHLRAMRHLIHQNAPRGSGAARRRFLGRVKPRVKRGELRWRLSLTRHGRGASFETRPLDAPQDEVSF